jgi:DnaJ-class molecular chaperone
MTDLVNRRCGYCDGSGRVNAGESAPDYQPCPVCTGFGKVRVPSSYGICPVCHGSGKKDIGAFSPRWVQCKNCHGSGWREPPSSYR